MLTNLLYYGVWLVIPYILKEKIRAIRNGVTYYIIATIILSSAVGYLLFTDLYLKFSVLPIVFFTYMILKKPKEKYLVENKNTGILTSKLSITKEKK